MAVRFSDEERQRYLDAFEASGRNYAEAARKLGVARSTMQYHINQAGLDQKHEMVAMPSFVVDGDEEESIDSLLSRRRQAFDRKIKAAQARRWFPIQVRETKPYALLIFGDPHLDNEGANWPLLDKHIAIANMDGVYSANIGDSTDNWPWTGRLAKLWSENDMSNKSAKKLASWFMFDAGIKWLVWLPGRPAKVLGYLLRGINVGERCHPVLSISLRAAESMARKRAAVSSGHVFEPLRVVDKRWSTPERIAAFPGFSRRYSSVARMAARASSRTDSRFSSGNSRQKMRTPSQYVGFS